MTAILGHISEKKHVDSVASEEITARKLLAPSQSIGASNQFTEFLSSLPCVIYEAGADLTVKMISPNVFDLIGIKAEAVRGNRTLWQERPYRDDRDRLMRRLEELTGTGIACENHRIIDDRGLPVWVSHSFRRVGKNVDIRIRGCMIPLSPDICAQPFDSNIISQFIHKIGNHFQLINLLIGSLKRNGVSKDEIDVLQETVDRAVEFTRSFSHYAQTPVYLPAVDFGEFIRSLMHSNALLFAEKRIELKAILDKCIDGTHVSADPFLLELAVTAVLREALDASNAGDKVVIEVKIEMTVPIGSIVRMSVVYNSCEMEAGILGEASAPFLTSKPERDGLGLSMAIRLIEAHGGLLNISTDANRGTRMEIVLPLCDAVKPSER